MLSFYSDSNKSVSVCVEEIPFGTSSEFDSTPLTPPPKMLGCSTSLDCLLIPFVGLKMDSVLIQQSCFWRHAVGISRLSWALM